MDIITQTTDFFIQDETAVAIGKFDGIHIGHQRLIQEILEQKKKGRKACIFTFDPPPAVLFQRSDAKELTTKEEKRRLLEYMGVDILIEFPMNRETAAMDPKTFIIEVLCNKMNAVFIAAGEDLSFGKEGTGNVGLLKGMAAENNLEVQIIKKIELNGINVSSTLVREAVESGNMLYAEQLLGMPYSVIGTVLHGNHIGHSLGMPTVNLIPAENKIMPPNGVYYSRVLFNGKQYRSISNVGYRPTVEEEEKRLGVETYLYDFSEDIYGMEITVELLAFKRPEQKFTDFEMLKRQLEEDMAAGAVYSL